MRALIYRGPGDVRLEKVSSPELRAAHEMIVEVEACAICGSDLHIYRGHGFSREAGFCIGHEAIGRVTDIGADVLRFRRGDRVMLSAGVGCGTCEPCRRGNAAACLTGYMRCYGIGAALQGCQAEAVAVPHADYNAALLPDGLSDEQALMLTDNLPTAMLAIENAHVGPQSTLCVIGLGPIGLMAVELAIALGVERVFALDLIARRRAIAASLGAVPLPVGNPKAALAEATSGKMATAIIEAVGTDQTLKSAFDLAAKGGVVSSIGVPSTKVFPFPIALAFNKGIGFRTGLCSVVRHWDILIPMLRTGAIRPERFFSHHLPLHRGADAYILANSGSADCLKVALKP